VDMQLNHSPKVNAATKKKRSLFKIILAIALNKSAIFKVTNAYLIFSFLRIPLF